jgi:hypothetical protein
MDYITNYKLLMPILPFYIDIVTGNAMLKRWANRQGLTYDEFLKPLLEDEDFQGGCIRIGGEGLILIVLPLHYDAGVIHHEAFHAASHMWYDVGADLQVPLNDEVLTYTMNYIADYITEVCYE